MEFVFVSKCISCVKIICCTPLKAKPFNLISSNFFVGKQYPPCRKQAEILDGIDRTTSELSN